VGEEIQRNALSADELRCLAALLDVLIPPRQDGDLPGAGQLGIAKHLQSELDDDPGFLAAMRSGLAALEDRARTAGATHFAALDAPARVEALQAVAGAQPGFLPGVLFHTYVGYYRDDRVLRALGLEARPPFPEGYALEPGDLDRLDAVRRRPRMWREC
jgi:hypothetical protein